MVQLFMYLFNMDGYHELHLNYDNELMIIIIVEKFSPFLSHYQEMQLLFFLIIYKYETNIVYHRIISLWRCKWQQLILVKKKGIEYVHVHYCNQSNEPFLHFKC